MSKNIIGKIILPIFYRFGKQCFFSSLSLAVFQNLTTPISEISHMNIYLHINNPEVKLFETKL